MLMEMYFAVQRLKNRYLSQRAQGMVEYALILAFVVAIAAVLTSDGGISGGIKTVFGKITTALGGGTTTSE